MPTSTASPPETTQNSLANEFHVSQLENRFSANSINERFKLFGIGHENTTDDNGYNIDNEHDDDDNDGFDDGQTAKQQTTLPSDDNLHINISS